LAAVCTLMIAFLVTYMITSTCNCKAILWWSTIMELIRILFVNGEMQMGCHWKLCHLY